MERKASIPNGLYRHYKGNLYEVIGIALHSETLEEMVVYRSLKEGGLWARPASMWSETVTVGENTMLRFSPIEQTKS